MKRGPKPKAEYLRFEGTPNHAVYLVEFGNCVKVGRALVPSQRFRSLHLEASRQGVALGRFNVFPVSDLYWAERACIQALRKVAAVMAGRHEYFSGITFDGATTIVRANFGDYATDKAGA